MGGEMRGDHNAFSDSYIGGMNEFAQNFMDCVYVTHTTYMKIAGLTSPSEYERAIDAHTRMGYSYYVTQLSVYQSISNPTNNNVDIDIMVSNIGVAPFYYPLSLKLECNDLISEPILVDILDKVIQEEAGQMFTFINLPATTNCLNSIVISLYSNHVYRPIRFAQGDDGIIRLSIPLPPTTPSSFSPVTPAPILISETSTPLSSPPLTSPPSTSSPISESPVTPAPVISPTFSPISLSPVTPAPIVSPTTSPVSLSPITPAPVSATSAPSPGKLIRTSLLDSIILVDSLSDKTISFLIDGQTYDLSKTGNALTIVIDNVNSSLYSGVFSWTEDDGTAEYRKVEYTNPIAMGGGQDMYYFSVSYLSRVGSKIIRIALKDILSNFVVEIKTISFTLI